MQTPIQRDANCSLSCSGLADVPGSPSPHKAASVQAMRSPTTVLDTEATKARGQSTRASSEACRQKRVPRSVLTVPFTRLASRTWGQDNEDRSFFRTCPCFLFSSFSSFFFFIFFREKVLIKFQFQFPFSFLPRSPMFFGPVEREAVISESHAIDSTHTDGSARVRRGHRKNHTNTRQMDWNGLLGPWETGSGSCAFGRRGKNVL